MNAYLHYILEVPSEVPRDGTLIFRGASGLPKIGQECGSWSWLLGGAQPQMFWELGNPL